MIPTLTSLLTLKIICQCDINYNMTLQVKTVMLVLKISTYIITSIPACPMGLTAIVAMISVSTFVTAIILSVKQYQEVIDGLCKCLFNAMFSNIPVISRRLVLIDGRNWHLLRKPPIYIKSY